MAVPVIMLSTSSTRSNPKPLDGLRVAVPAYVFVTPEPGITRVVFKIDGLTQRTETAAPWDFNGTAANGTAVSYPFPRKLPGKHTITADVTQRGVLTRYTAVFTVVGALVTPSTVPARTAVPAPAPTARRAVLTVTSPVTVTHTPYVQDMNYVAAAQEVPVSESATEPLRAVPPPPPPGEFPDPPNVDHADDTKALP